MTENRFDAVLKKAREERRTLIMGIVNVTPDSFSDGGNFFCPEAAAAHAERLAACGADVIDVGAESTRPGAGKIDEAEELSRLLPALEAIRKILPDVPVSVDTYHAGVAAAALEAGADIINDVCAVGPAENSGERICGTAKAAAAAGAYFIAVHNRFGNEIQDKNFMKILIEDLRAGTENLLKTGVPAEKLWLDPGFGFGKSVRQNLQIVKNMREIVRLGFPVLLGTSRKSTLGKILGGKAPKERFGADAACAAFGIAGGAAMLRVHDAAEMRDVALAADALMRAE